MRILLPILRSAALLTALAATAMPSSSAAEDRVEWQHDVEAAKQIAQRQQRLVLLHFWSENCPPCRRLEKTTFKRRDFVHALHANYVPVKLNVLEHRALARQYNIKSIPTDVIVAADGRELFRTISPGDPGRYVGMLDQVAAHARLHMRPNDVPGHELSEHVAIDAAAPSPPVTAPIRPRVAAQQPGSDVAHRPPAHYELPPPHSAGPNDAQASLPADPYRQDAAPPPAASSPLPTPYTPPPTRANPHYHVPEVVVAPEPTAPAEQADPAAPVPSRADQLASSNIIRPPGSAPPTGTLSRYSRPGPADSLSVPGGTAAAPSAAAAGPVTTPPAAPSLPSAPRTAPTTESLAQVEAFRDNRSRHSIDQFLPFRAEPPSAPAPNSAPPAATPAAVPPSSPAASDPAISIANATAGPSSLPPLPVASLVLDGCCPVTLVEEARWQRGDAQFRVTYKQRIYWFASAAHAARFQARPDHYAPVMSGYDIVHLKRGGQAVPGKREHGIAFRNQYYLFADEQSLQAFSQAPESYLEVIQQAYEQRPGDAKFWR